ncbi:TIM barrel protein [Rudanella paleaurantiibacter]|uniref:TIM barrel protein n=1 Tax=Rudanella paleaurantiibacter TaxID=2614655 RepID=A0A7J5TYQ5_9BACT|nr:sugar phosphate isomerase/epimerase [Rudanella paleaurantiibacter]KAB7730244.1 TIM barrel protein [Rudanella paleaurantiibacter]
MNPITKSMSRRSVLKAGALALTAPFLSKLDALALAPKAAGLQLYTLRNELGKDLEGTIAKVAQIGYKKVENFGYADGKFFGKSPKEYAALLKNNGLLAPSGHYLLGKAMPNMKGTLMNDWSRAVDDAAELGQQYMICAFLFPDERKSLDDYKRYADLFNKAAETCKARGIQFGYHNHDFEFMNVEGQVPYDVLLKNTDPKLVKMELDLYWTVFAGKDPVELFKQNPGRFPLWHLKDMAKTEKREFAEVGTGSIDFARLLKAKKTAGLVHSFVEQDVCQRPPLEAIAISYQNVQKLNI